MSSQPGATPKLGDTGTGSESDADAPPTGDKIWIQISPDPDPHRSICRPNHIFVADAPQQSKSKSTEDSFLIDAAYPYGPPLRASGSRYGAVPARTGTARHGMGSLSSWRPLQTEREPCRLLCCCFVSELCEQSGNLVAIAAFRSLDVDK